MAFTFASSFAFAALALSVGANVCICLIEEVAPDACVMRLEVRMNVSVLLRGECFEMLGVDAAPVSAAVVNLIAHRDRPDQKFVGGTMGDCLLAPDLNASIAPLADVADPVPAPVSIDLVPHTRILEHGAEP